MIDQLVKILEQAGVFISLFAASIIIVGFFISLGNYALGFRKIGPIKDFNRFKVQFGKILTLGLEILVLSDVIETILIPPTFKSLLGLIFLLIVRTFVSWTLGLEIDGRWPWQIKKEKSNV